ncbi:MAG: DUF4331 family protein [Thermomicrobiales bacterium]
MSYHLSGPNLRSPEGDARLDLTDVFAFLAPNDPNRCVLIMDVNPFAPTQGAEFHPDAVYRLNVDNDGNAVSDVALSVVFSQPRDGQQTATVYLATGEQARQAEAAGESIIEGAPVSFGTEPRIVEAGPYRFFAGLRSDPFFADLDGIVHEFQWTGVDSMADKNVFGVVLEMPNAILGSDPPIGVWARISLHRNGGLVSIDRGAHPSLTAYFNPEDAKDEYNRREPAQDRDNYLAAWSTVLQHTGGYTSDEAATALEQVLPDVLRFDRSQPAAYPNGRRLSDDVTDARLSFVTKGKIPGDNIGPHTDLLSDFPYLGTPHPVATPSDQPAA